MKNDIPDWVAKSRSSWTNTGVSRPHFAVAPKAGQESVWDYPRPPAVVPDSRVVTVHAGPHEIARTTRALRVLETASPPTFYIPPADVQRQLLKKETGSSLCEWKGAATYWSVDANGVRVKNAAWSYPDPFPEFEVLRDHYAFYPGKLTCHVAAELVVPQAGGFYGGWVTSEIVGPFKGDPGTQHW